MYNRTSFYIRIPLPDGLEARFFRIKVSVFDDLLELNRCVHDKKLWPKDKLVYAFNVGYPKGGCRRQPYSHMMLAKGMIDPGIIGHEGEHAVFFMLREAIGIKTLDLSPTNRFKELGKTKVASASEEFVCRSLQYVIESIYEEAKRRNIEL